jgi:hypothetical protein
MINPHPMVPSCARYTAHDMLTRQRQATGAPRAPLRGVCAVGWDCRSVARDIDRVVQGSVPVANRTKVTQQKRARERAKQERHQEKIRRREEAKTRKGNSPRTAGGEDPDIAGIIPGPQPSPWGDEEDLPE